MPRSLARLRYRTLKKPVPFPNVHSGPYLEQSVAKYVERQSSPPLLRLQTVVNHKARRQPSGQYVPEPWKPFTLRNVVDPAATAQHGHIIYVFRNVQTNQILYSLQELLDDHHLEQLPFIGKHSKPPVLRPDEWVPHCVVTFPTPEQGHSAFRRLREFRKLHELAWDKTNPEYKKLHLKHRIRKLMNQRANFSADLAEVLRMQAEYGARARQEREELDQKAVEYRQKRWRQIDELAQAAKDKTKVADNVKWLQGQIRSMGLKLRMKHNQNEADQKRLKAAKESLEIRLRRVSYALRKVEQRKQARDDLTTRAAPANEAGAEEKLRELESKARNLREALDYPDPTRSAADIAGDEALLTQVTASISTLTSAFEAQSQLASETHTTDLSVLPKFFKKKISTPFTLEGVDVAWADLQDALYARGQWPDEIAHQSLDLNKARGNVALLSQEEFNVEVGNEVSKIVGVFQAKRNADREKAGLPPFTSEADRLAATA